MSLSLFTFDNIISISFIFGILFYFTPLDIYIVEDFNPYSGLNSQIIYRLHI